jgi:hypothetical protein
MFRLPIARSRALVSATGAARGVSHTMGVASKPSSEGTDRKRGKKAAQNKASIDSRSKENKGFMEDDAKVERQPRNAHRRN